VSTAISQTLFNGKASLISEETMRQILDGTPSLA
jgi:hypothetical protein